MNQNRRRLAAGALAATGVLHLALAPEYFGEQAYVGALFVLGGLAGLLVAARLWVADHLASWALGAAISAGMGLGFILSRTIGLPGFHESELEASGLLSLVFEGGFLFLAAPVLRAGLGRGAGADLARA